MLYGKHLNVVPTSPEVGGTTIISNQTIYKLTINIFNALIVSKGRPIYNLIKSVPVYIGSMILLTDIE